MQKFLARFAPYRKYVVALITNEMGVWALAMTNVLSGQQLAYAATAAFFLALGVYVAPNDPKA